MVKPEKPNYKQSREYKSINMATFSTTIKVNSTDVAALKEQGYSLYAFKAVAASGSGQPTVWFKLDQDNLLTNNVLSWTEKYQGYNSVTQIGNNVQVVASNTVDTDLGNLITIDQDSGNLTNSTDGLKGTISFLNNAKKQYTIGINQMVDGISNILCAFPILGSGSARVITPVTKIALIFSTAEIVTATVVTKAMSSGAFIDLTGTNSRTVSFSLTDGWSATNSPSWISTFNAFTDMSSLLIESPDSREKDLRLKSNKRVEVLEG